MLAFRVSLNGRVLATAGFPGPHVIGAILTSVVRDEETKRKWQSKGKFRWKELDLRLGGLLTLPNGAKHHVDWANRTVKVGDKILISIVDEDVVDDPRDRHNKITIRIPRSTIGNPRLEAKRAPRQAAQRRKAVQHGVAAVGRPRTAARC